MFHDHDWEAALLKQALASDAFYIGALGSARAHDARCQSLLDLGLFAAQIERIHGPIGIIPSMHDASSLAISVLAEIISEYSCLDTP
jgi:xanthine dehydrogenase accessory factor